MSVVVVIIVIIVVVDVIVVVEVVDEFGRILSWDGRSGLARSSLLFIFFLLVLFLFFVLAIEGVVMLLLLPFEFVAALVEDLDDGDVFRRPEFRRRRRRRFDRP